MTGHEKFEIQRLIRDGDGGMLRERYESLQASGRDDDAKDFMKMAHETNKARKP